MAANAWDSYDTVFLNSKAGMDGVDKKKVQKVVYDMSKGSRYFNNEQRKEADVLQRIRGMNARAERLTPALLAEHMKATDLKLAELEATRDLSRVWVHVDMDAFYAAVEMLVDPSLVGKPLAVGGMSMICTANYEARKFGVRAAMPGFIARKLCPDLVFVRPDFKKYTHYSELTRQVFREYDANYVARSLDEAYLDITLPCLSRKLSAAEVAEELRNKVYTKTGLTCSAGVGPNRLLAKVCSDINKPNGQFVVPSERGAIMAFISSLPIRKVSGIGKVTERLLKEVLDVSVCADLIGKRSFISALFSRISTEFFLAIGLGIGGSETPEKEHRKSLSNERTFRAISNERQLYTKLEELVDLLVSDMQKEDLQGRTLTLKLKETGFEVRSRAVTLPNFTCTKAEIWEHACKLLKGELPLSLRLMGLRMSNFKDEKPQLLDPNQRTLTKFMIQPTTSSSLNNFDGHSTTFQPSTADSSIAYPSVSDPSIAKSLIADSSRSDPSTADSSVADPFISDPLIVDPLVSDPPIADPSFAYSCGTSAQKFSYCHKEVQSGRENDDHVMPQLTTSVRSPFKQVAKTQQAVDEMLIATRSTFDADRLADLPHKPSPNLMWSSGNLLSRSEECCPTQIEPMAQIQKDHSAVSGMELLRTKQKSTQSGQELHFEEKTWHGTVADVHQSGSRLKLSSKNFTGTNVGKRKAAAEDDFDSLTRREDCKPRVQSPFSQSVASCEGGSEPTINLEIGQQEYGAFERGCNSPEDKILVDESSCSLCGMEVNYSLPSARQEHEDFHFALSLQAQGDETNFQRFGLTRPLKNTLRPVEKRSSKKKRVNQGTGSLTLDKRSSHLTMETFFGKSK